MGAPASALVVAVTVAGVAGQECDKAHQAATAIIVKCKQQQQRCQLCLQWFVALFAAS
jgi:hypothetical protein